MSKIELGDLEKTSAEIADMLTNKPVFDNTEDAEPELREPFTMLCDAKSREPSIQKTKIVRHVAFKKPVSPPAAAPNNETERTVRGKTDNTSKPDCFSVAGFNVPKHTLYLLVVLTILGVAIFYMTGKSTPPPRNRDPSEIEGQGHPDFRQQGQPPKRRIKSSESE